MRLDPNYTESNIFAEIAASAERQYGAERAEALRGNLQHLARMMALVGERQLELDADAPDTSGIPERSEP
jgi:hypothetical protein